MSSGVPGVIIAAPASGSGKTFVTLALLRTLRDAGVAVRSFKTGPDYIDPAFHAAASGHPCFNLDTWAMRPSSLSHVLNLGSHGATLTVCEGVMGLFDGASLPGTDRAADGSTADLAARTGWPVVLVVDVKGQAASAAATVRGFRDLRTDITLSGVLFNRVGGAVHLQILKDAMARHVPDVQVLGGLPRAPEALHLPDRHLGLVQAGEHAALETFLSQAATFIQEHLDVQALQDIARVPRRVLPEGVPLISPLADRMAVARDEAFSFCYAAQLEAWQAAGCHLDLFSPLANDPVPENVNTVYFPGGYPELHGGQLAASRNTWDSLAAHVARGGAVFGECGGYMVLGKTLVDAKGVVHPMAGLLDLVTSFEKPALHLGYREAEALGEFAFGTEGQPFRGHEFHYSSALEEQGEPLFKVANASGRDMGSCGLRAGNVAGSYLHLIDGSD